MARAECMYVVRSQYSEPGVYIRTLWPKGSPLDAELSQFENTDSVRYLKRKHGEHRILVAEVSELGPPFDRTERWDVELPADWVNSLYLEFDGDRLVRIQRSRWLFERP